MIDVIHAEQVHLFYRARMLGPDLDPGPESLEARLFTEEEIPWEQLAFHSTAQALKDYLGGLPDLSADPRKR